jgi:hypothetical protein
LRAGSKNSLFAGYDGADGVFAWRFDDHSYTSPAEAEKQLIDALGDYLGLQTQGQESPRQRVEALCSAYR